MNGTGASIANLQQRSQLLRAVRQFFDERGFVEVETPLLSAEIIPELHIEPFEAANGYLQASPELHMKRLVAADMPAIFQITKSFRRDEHGPLHRREFTIVEWYRTGDDMQAGMQLLDDLCQATLGTSAARQTSYAAAFKKYVGLCPHTSTVEELAAKADELEVPVVDNRRFDDRDEWLNLLLSFQVEPHLGRDRPEMLFDYPASQAALAKTAKDQAGVETAKRFELYWRGVELADGYDELTDATELRTRLRAVNQGRQAEGKALLPLPESLLATMNGELPECSGCALGFDRLAMLACGAESISEVMAFPDG